MRILGVDIEELSRGEIRGFVDTFLRESGYHRIATVNPEFLVAADRDAEFFAVLRRAELRVADGAGIVIAGWLHGKSIRRYPGADLIDYILKKAERGRLPVFFAVRKGGLSSFADITRAVKAMYPGLICSGGEIDFDRAAGIPDMGDCAIVLCNAGAPEQEYFLEGIRGCGGGPRLGMGVGGALDFLTGRKKRAPRVLRALGLEWLWRLLLQPKRIGRIWNATAVFLWKLLKS